tara:strand:+ start:85 stop:579 length:495 start_codon:yes stop_codon:yes gene_type:complete
MKISKIQLKRIIREAKNDQDQLDKYEGILWDLENAKRLSNPSEAGQKEKKIAWVKEKIASLKKKINESPKSKKIKLTKNHLRKIIREEYTRLKNQGLIMEYYEDSSVRYDDYMPTYDEIYHNLDGWAQVSMGRDYLISGLQAEFSNANYEMIIAVVDEWLAENY